MFDEVVITEDAETGHGRERGQESMRIGHGGGEVFARGIAKVARDDDGIAGNSLQTVDQGVGEFRDKIEMQIGELEEAKAFKCRWETGKMPSALDQARIEVIGAGSASEPGEDEALVDEGVEGKVLFEFEDAAALVGHLSPVTGLSHEPVLESLRSQAKGEACVGFG